MKHIMLFILLLIPSVAWAQSDPSFEVWLEALRQEAQQKGISQTVIADALSAIIPNETVIRLDRKQPEGQVTLDEYLAKTVTEKRIEQGRELRAQYQDLLQTIAQKYQVQPEFMLALWGMETNYGSNIGGFDTIEALATLAYDGRRSSFFRGELLAALKILQQDNLARSNFKGSWAGAMGQCQFMPSSFLKFAVDYDHDGKHDIWENEADVLASIAHYLSESGWDGSQSVIADEGAENNNYRVLLKWNRSRYFATAVGQLADAIRE